MHKRNESLPKEFTIIQGTIKKCNILRTYTSRYIVPKVWKMQFELQTYNYLNEYKQFQSLLT